MNNIDSSKAVVLGCTVGVLSLATQSVGLTLQRKSHIQEDEKPPHIPRRPAYRRHMWQTGLLLFLLSNVIGSSVQITTLPLVILSPLQAVGLVFNSIFSSLLLDEPFTQFAMLGTVLVALGALAVAFFGVVPEPHHNLAELLILLHRKPFVIWMLCTFVLMAGIMLLIHVSKTWAPHPKHPDRLNLLRGMLYGVICGTLSAHSLLMAKSAVEIIVRGFSDQWKDLWQYQSWAIVGCFLFFAISQLYFLNCALHLCSTSVIYPLNFCIYNIITIMNGLIYFEQTSKLSTVNYVLIALGTLLILAGVVCLSWRLGLSDDLGLHHNMQQQCPGEVEPFCGSFTNSRYIDSSRDLQEACAAKPEYAVFKKLASSLSSDTDTNHFCRMADGPDKSYGSTLDTLTDETSPMLQHPSSTNYYSFASKSVEEPLDQQAGIFQEPVSPFTSASENSFGRNVLNPLIHTRKAPAKSPGDSSETLI